MARTKKAIKSAALTAHADWAKRMKGDWNKRAAIDPYWAVLNLHNPGEWDRNEFFQSGEDTLINSLDHLSASLPDWVYNGPILEIGCGVGRIAAGLSKRFGRVIGLDVSSEMIEEAARNMKLKGIGNVELIEGNGVDLSGIEDGSVTGVYSCIVFQHIPDPEIQYGLLREVGRVLESGGFFMISLYVNQAEYDFLYAEWLKRREAKDLQGWSPLALPELPRFETAMCNAVNPERVKVTLTESGLSLDQEHTDTILTVGLWWIAGRKL